MQFSADKAVILATATVNPRGMPNVARSDPAVRLRDYNLALRKWLRRTDFPIIFCENSGADLTVLRKTAAAFGDRVEFLSFVAPDFPLHHGKGYGECLILAEALRTSKHVDRNFIVKTTGRLFVSNADALFGSLYDQEVDVALDWHFNDLNFADSRLFVTTREFLQTFLIDRADQLDEREGRECYFEHLLARGVLERALAGGHCRAFDRHPVYEGISGTANDVLGVRGEWIRRRQRLVARLRGILNK